MSHTLCSVKEKPLQQEACALEQEYPYLLQLEKSPHSNENPAQPKINNKI